MQTMIARAVSFLAVTNRRKSVDHRSVFEDDAKPIESACRIWQVLFKSIRRLLFARRISPQRRIFVSTTPASVTYGMPADQVPDPAKRGVLGSPVALSA
jgi:hypothetical protein